MGTIVDFDESSCPPMRLLQWDARTLTELIGKKALERAEREDLQGDRMWLHLTDMGGLDPGEGTEPPQLVKRVIKPRVCHGVPLTDEETRVTRLSGLPKSAGPPAVTHEALEVYHEYLCAHMRIPFVGEYSRKTVPLEHMSESIKITGLASVSHFSSPSAVIQRN